MTNLFLHTVKKWEKNVVVNLYFLVAEFGTLHMEFAYLSDVTGDPKYKEAVEKVRAVIKDAERPKVTEHQSGFQGGSHTFATCIAF